MAKKNHEFYKLINPIIRIRNLVSGIKKENYFYPNLRSISPLTKKKSKYQFCDLVRMVQYPTGGGFVSKHHDYDKYYPKGIINVVLPITVRKNGKARKLSSYERGGFYFYNKKKKIDVETYVETGDLLMFNTKISHGVNSIDSHKNLNLDSSKGRINVAFSIAKFLI